MTEQFCLTDEAYEYWRLALRVFNVTAEEILEDWLPFLQGKQWTVSPDGIVSF